MRLVDQVTGGAGRVAIAAGLLLATAGAWGQQNLPPGAGRDLVASKCYACHALEARVGGGYTAEGWNTVLRMMTNHGLALTADEIAQLKPYLVQNFPEKPKAAAVLVPGPTQVAMQVFPALTPGARPHDSLATRDGGLWYTGQMANVLGRVDPATGQVKEYPLKTAHSGPHGLMEDANGNIWYTANTGAAIGRLDPRTGAVTEYPMPDPTVGDPHTLVFDAKGILWFTAQNANRVGRLDPKTGEIKLAAMPTTNARPYGMAVDSKGTVFIVEFGTNGVAAVDPITMGVREYKLPNAASRPRRIAITGDDMVWYTDYSRGMIGRLDPATGQVKEWPSPSGPKSAPYGISAIGGALWYSESETTPNTVVRFDPKTEAFQSWAIPGGGYIVRNTSVTSDGHFLLANSLANAVTLVKIPK
jgi:virginiamycin B lyase